MIGSKGFRLAFAGFIVLLAGAVALLFSNLAAIILMLVGGMAVWCGFVWTLFQYYTGPQSPGDT